MRGFYVRKEYPPYYWVLWQLSLNPALALEYIPAASGVVCILRKVSENLQLCQQYVDVNPQSDPRGYLFFSHQLNMASSNALSSI